MTRKSILVPDSNEDSYNALNSPSFGRDAQYNINNRLNSLLILYFICIFLLLLPTWRIKPDDDDDDDTLYYSF